VCAARWKRVAVRSKAGDIPQTYAGIADDRSRSGKVAHYAGVFAQIVEEACPGANGGFSVAPGIKGNPQARSQQHSIAVSKTAGIAWICVEHTAGKVERPDELSDCARRFYIIRIIRIASTLRRRRRLILQAG